MEVGAQLYIDFSLSGANFIDSLGPKAKTTGSFDPAIQYATALN
jgi:hypothetical protein